jgi:hypothetical protein
MVDRQERMTDTDNESSPAVRNAMRFFHQEVRIKELEATIDTKDTEIARLNNLLRSEGANRYWEARWRDADAEIALLQEGRQLHDELVDHLEHVIAQAAAALEMADWAINPRDRSSISLDTWNKRLKASTTTIHQALVACRALTPENKTEAK